MFIMTTKWANPVSKDCCADVDEDTITFDTKRAFGETLEKAVIFAITTYSRIHAVSYLWGKGIYLQYAVVQVIVNWIDVWSTYVFCTILGQRMEPRYKGDWNSKCTLMYEPYWKQYSLTETCICEDSDVWVTRWRDSWKWSDLCPAFLNEWRQYLDKDNREVVETFDIFAIDDRRIIQSAKDTHSFDSHIRKKQRLDNETQAKIQFLSVEYSHPRMWKSVFLQIPADYYYTNNVLFTPGFVMRCLQYQRQWFIFDMNYTLTLLDSNIESTVLSGGEYVILTEGGFQVKRISDHK